jgi:hypothetical protein
MGKAYCAKWSEAEACYFMHLPSDEVASSDDGEEWKDENGLGLLPSEVPERIAFIGGPLAVFDPATDPDAHPDGGTHSAACSRYRTGDPEDCTCEGGASGE